MATNNLNHPAVLDSELQIMQFETDVQMESLPNEIFDSMTGEINFEQGEKQAAIPEAGFLQLNARANDARQVTIPMLKEFTQAPNLGSLADPRGNEEDFVTKDFIMQYTDESHASTAQSYGITARDKIPYRIFEKRVPLEGRYWRQYSGKTTRQMLLEGQSENLLSAPHYNAPMLNPNWFLPNLKDSEQPVYRLNYYQFTNQIVDGLNDASYGVTSTTSPKCAVSVEYLQRLQDWAFATKFLTPLDLPDGKEGYVCVLPLPQVTWLMHPVNERALGRNLRFDQKDIEMAYPGSVGMIGRLVIVPDMRYPTITPSGSPSASYPSSSGTLTTAYYGIGRADDGSSDPRDKTSAAWQVGWILGKRFGCEWTPEKLHWEYEFEMYDKFFGAGMFRSTGKKLVMFHKQGSKHSYTMQHDGSAVLPFKAPPTTGYSS